MTASVTEPRIGRSGHRAVGVDELGMEARVGEVLNRHPAVGLAVGVVGGGRLEFFHGHGVADIAANTPVTQDTVFRIGSITKTFTAIAVLQLWEQGLVDLDAPANDYLRAYRLIPAKAAHRPATLRQLLTHTAGLPELLYPWRAYTPILGQTVRFGQPLPSLAEFYRGGLHLVAEPGTSCTYSNHGFATLGQLVEDVTGQPLDRYFRDHLFDPLGMANTDLLPSMFAPHYQPDPRLPGIGLAFFRDQVGGHLVVEHEGLVPGFSSQLSLAPDDGVGVVAFTNGARGASAWLGPEVSGLLRYLLGVPDRVIGTEVPHHPELWGELCGWYAFRGSFRDVQRWFVLGAEVFVRRGQLMLRALSPIPAVSRGLALHPDDERDPYVFRIDLSGLGLGTARVVFSREAGVGTTAIHLEFAPALLWFDKQPATKNPRPWATGALGAVAAATAATAARRFRPSKEVR